MRNSAASASPPWWTWLSSYVLPRPSRRSRDRYWSSSPGDRRIPIAASCTSLQTEALSSSTAHTGRRLGAGKPAERTVEHEQNDQSEAGRRKGKPGHYLLRLFIAGGGQNSHKALTNLQSLCREHLEGRYTIETIDVVEDFQAAVRDNILVTPALILVAPLPG